MIEVAKPAAEGNQVIVGELLVTKQKNLMIEPRTINGLKVIRFDFAEIDVPDLRTNRLFAGYDPHCVGLYQKERGL
jgi:hypothetical protein